MAVNDTILVLRALGLGDLLTALPALRGLRRAHPGARIVLATPAPLAGLGLLSGAVDEVLPTGGLGELRYAGPPPELAVNLHGSGPQSIADMLATRPRRLITHRNRHHPDVLGPPWRAGQHEVDRWCALLGNAGILCNTDDLSLSRPMGPPDRTGVVVVHPGAASEARRWPAERFAEVAAALHRQGYPVVITGSPAETTLADEVARRAGLPGNAVLAGRLDVLELVALIGDSRLLVCGDTGVGHIATATGTPSVLVFGPTPPARWGPRGAAIRVAKVVNGVALPEEFGTGQHGDTPPGKPPRHPAGGAHRHSGFQCDDRTVRQDVAEPVDGGFHRAQICRPVRCAGSGDADEHRVPVGQVAVVVAESQPSGGETLTEQQGQAGFVDHRLPGAQRPHLGGVDIDAHRVQPPFGQADRSGESDVAGAHHSDARVGHAGTARSSPVADSTRSTEISSSPGCGRSACGSPTSPAHSDTWGPS